MKRLLPSVTIFISLVFSCKSPQKLFEEGQYERAIYSSLEDLKKNPSNAKALQLLPTAYGQASKQLLNDIEVARAFKRSDRPDKVYQDYNSLQKLYVSINALAAASAVVSAVDYSNELRNAANEAAEFRYSRGAEYLKQGDKINAKKAYEDFKMADSYVPGYKDVIQLKDQALDMAVTNVALNNIRQQFGYYSLNGAFLENDILWDLKTIGRDNYYLFYTVSDAQYKNIRVDQFIDLAMYDIWFGTLSGNSYSYNVSREINEPAPNPKDPPVKIYVSATVSVTRRILDSRAEMDCRITDSDNRRIIFSQRFPAHYTWENLSGSYSGDQRALSARDWAIVNGIYNNPPSYDDLYRELTKQLLNDFNYRMRQVYGR